jgi:hypothetical protein
VLTSWTGEGFPRAGENGLKTKTLSTRLLVDGDPARG